MAVWLYPSPEKSLVRKLCHTEGICKNCWSQDSSIYHSSYSLVDSPIWKGKNLYERFDCWKRLRKISYPSKMLTPIGDIRYIMYVLHHLTISHFFFYNFERNPSNFKSFQVQYWETVCRFGHENFLFLLQVKILFRSRYHAYSIEYSFTLL
jgi:hypothetical protein